MNRCEAKALAAELGISKAEVRQWGHLSKTRTWLDAIAVHQAISSRTAEAAEDVEGAAIALPVWESCPALPLPTAITEAEPCAAGVSAADGPVLCGDPWLEKADLLEAAPGDEVPSSQTAVYPILVLFVVVWLLCRLLLGLACLLGLALSYLLRRVGVGATALGEGGDASEYSPLGSR